MLVSASHRWDYRWKIILPPHAYVGFGDINDGLLSPKAEISSSWRRQQWEELWLRAGVTGCLVEGLLHFGGVPSGPEATERFPPHSVPCVEPPQPALTAPPCSIVPIFLLLKWLLIVSQVCSTRSIQGDGYEYCWIRATCLVLPTWNSEAKVYRRPQGDQ